MVMPRTEEELLALIVQYIKPLYYISGLCCVLLIVSVVILIKSIIDKKKATEKEKYTFRIFMSSICCGVFVFAAILTSFIATIYTIVVNMS